MSGLSRRALRKSAVVRISPGECLSAPEADLVAPRWGRKKAKIQYDIERRLATRGTWQGKCFEGTVARPAPSEARMAASGLRSQQVFRLFAYGLLTTILLLLPVFPATSIVRERNQRTLTLLLNSPLGPWRIYFGKLLSALGVSGLVLSLSLPAAAACYASGGVSLTGDADPAEQYTLSRAVTGTRTVGQESEPNDIYQTASPLDEQNRAEAYDSWRLVWEKQQAGKA